MIFRLRYFYLKIFSEFQITLSGYRPAQQSYNPQKEYRTHHGSNQISNDADSRNTKQAEKPTAEYTADYAHNQVDDNPKTTSLHQFTGNKSGHNSNDNIPQKTHNS